MAKTTNDEAKQGTGSTAPEQKTYTQEEVDALIQNKLDETQVQMNERMAKIEAGLGLITDEQKHPKKLHKGERKVYHCLQPDFLIMGVIKDPDGTVINHIRCQFKSGIYETDIIENQNIVEANESFKKTVWPVDPNAVDDVKKAAEKIKSREYMEGAANTKSARNRVAQQI